MSDISTSNDRISSLVIDHITKNRFSTIALSHQTATYKVFAKYIYYYIANNPNTNVAITCPKKATLDEFVTHLKNIYRGREPFSQNNKFIRFANGSMLKFYVAHKNTSIVGEIDLLLMLDMALCRNSDIKPFYNNILPYLVAKKDSRIILSSHMAEKDNNLFYDIFRNAESTTPHTKSIFAPLRVYHWYRPDVDHHWVNYIIGEIGSRAFNLYYNMSNL